MLDSPNVKGRPCKSPTHVSFEVYGRHLIAHKRGHDRLV